MIENIKKYLPWLVVVGLIFFIFTKSCGGGVGVKSSTVTDTVYVDKIIKVPEIRGSFNNSKPKIVKTKEFVYDEQLISDFKKIKDENSKLKAYQESVRVNNYKNVYSNDKDSTVVVTVEDSVIGRLTNQRVSFIVKEREVLTKEMIITKKLKPKFSMSAGGGVQMQVNPIMSSPRIEAVLGFKNKNGYTLDLGYNSSGEARITLKKDLFTYWGKQ